MPVEKTTITPFLVVADANKAIAFYTAAFGATELARYAMPEDKLSLKITIEDTLFYLSDEEPSYGRISDLQPGGIRVILATNNADDFFSKALELGATEICPMTTETDWRIGCLKDPFGHIWELGYTL